MVLLSLRAAVYQPAGGVEAEIDARSAREGGEKPPRTRRCKGHHL
jgi:hypothetical protein